ncbi:unnamed protein product [Larinioides sclopetarius]|uniref:Major facilitator superfamily (MFS) profile domain-containing protein n=1 Tax=Larinioides sclopetarius TaxID=280406 RepID=A0AAV2BA98_9ARAC
MFEKMLFKVQNHKKSYALNIPSISERVDLAHSGPKKTRRCCFGERHVVTLVGFLTCFLLTANRLVLSVGIVAMVKHVNAKESSKWNESEIICPMPSKPPKLVVGSNFQGEFDWSTELQGYLLGFCFISYLITQIPGGKIADAVGSKPLMVYSSAATGILTFISPFAARWHIYALMTAQFLKGATQGLTTPTIYKLISNWIPRHERGTLSTLVVCGYAAGAAVSGMVTGWLCDIPGLGWPFAFYIWGIITVLASIIFFFIYYEHPKDHPWITDEELNYISDGWEIKISTKPSTPWRKMLSSVHSYAYFYGLFGHYWSIAYYITVHPTFMGTVLHYPMTEVLLGSLFVWLEYF